MSKPKGGRGQRQSYTTSVMRVPDPIKPQVEQLIQDFYTEKPVTSLKQLSIDAVIELDKTKYPRGLKVDGYSLDGWDLSCPLKDGGWTWGEEYEQFWQKEQRPVLERFLQLADEVNLCIWQIDNSFALTEPSSLWSKCDVRAALSRLIKYRLIAYFEAKPVTAFELAQWIVDSKLHDFHLKDYEDIVKAALEYERKNVLKALRVGDMPPVDRKEYWFNFYSENIGKPDVDYWDWAGNPELNEFSPELSNLLQLSRPVGNLLYFLQALPEGKHPFYKAEPDGRYEGDMFVASFNSFLNSGKYGSWEADRKNKTVEEFRRWHSKAIKTIGLENLKKAYKVCFKAEWHLIQEILNSPNYVLLEMQRDRDAQNRAWEHFRNKQRGQTNTWAVVLGVAANATKEQVKKAYRDLCKQYHPDVCSNGEEKMKEINNAYTEWEKQYQTA